MDFSTKQHTRNTVLSIWRLTMRWCSLSPSWRLLLPSLMFYCIMDQTSRKNFGFGVKTRSNESMKEKLAWIFMWRWCKFTRKCRSGGTQSCLWWLSLSALSFAKVWAYSLFGWSTITALLNFSYLTLTVYPIHLPWVSKTLRYFFNLNIYCLPNVLLLCLQWGLLVAIG